MNRPFSPAKATLFAAIITASLVSGCQDQGQVTAMAWGEGFIEDGIDASEVGDGWRIDFDTFVVSFSDVSLDGQSLGGGKPVDLTLLTNGVGQPLLNATVQAGDYTSPGFVIERVQITGAATKAETTKRFGWTFDVPTQYDGCEAEVAVSADQPGSFQATVHADHLFYNSLVSENPDVLFGALADADTDGDDQITQAELAATGLGSYDGGSEGDVNDLWAFLVAQSRTLGHINGEGHCDIVR